MGRLSAYTNTALLSSSDDEKNHQINTDQIQEFNPQQLILLAKKSAASRDAIFSAMQRMIENSPAQIAQAKENFLQGDLNTSMQILHNMRGALGTIGAKYFSENALELEMAIRAENVADINELFTKTEHSLSNALCMAKDWLSVQYSATGQEKSQANSLNLKETIELLISQLRQNNISACDTFSSNRHLLINMLSSEDIQHVESSIESLDFESALLIFNQLHL